MILRQLFERILVGGRRAGRRFLHRLDALFDEENFLDLFRRIQIERLAGQRMRSRLQLLHLGAELATLDLEQAAIEQHAVPLHGLQDPHRRHFEFAVNCRQPGIRLNLRIQGVMQLQGDVGIFGGILGGRFNRHLIEANLLRPLAGDFFKADRLHAKMALGKAVHVVRTMTLQHIRLQQRVVLYTGEMHAVIGKDVGVVFQVLPKLERRRVFQPRLHFCQHRLDAQLLRRTGIAMIQRDIRGVSGFDGERNPHQPRAQRFQASGFGIDRGQCGGVDFLQPRIKLLCGQHRLVGARHDRGHRCRRRHW